MSSAAFCQPVKHDPAFTPDSIRATIDRVNEHFLNNKWKRVDRNWIRGTYYTGLMAVYNATQEQQYLDQATAWGARHGWRTGTEWIYPANRMTCVQTYLELYFLLGNPSMIENAREVMTKKIQNDAKASKQGWDYVDALYVGTPAYVMMSRASDNPGYKDYAHRMFQEVYDDLYDPGYSLFYRDLKAQKERTSAGNPVFWSRGNGWAIASIPRILIYLETTDPNRSFYEELLQEMAGALKKSQGPDGFWRVNLTDSLDYPGPESSGTAFFTYALTWGINNGFLSREQYLPVVRSAWTALYHHVDPEGSVCWGQDVARGPEKVSKNDSHEFVSGAFLLAASEVLKMIERTAQEHQPPGSSNEKSRE